MELKIVILITVFSIANASVIIDPFQIVEEDTEVRQELENLIDNEQLTQASYPELLSTKSSCSSNRECRPRCRDLGFQRYTCSAGLCLCYIPMIAKVEPETEVRPRLETYIASDQLTQASYPELLSTKSSCSSNRECRPRCRDLGFQRYTCSAGLCLCYIPMIAKVEPETEVRPGLETYITSDQLTQASYPELLSTKSSCSSNRECKQRCRDLGFQRYTCSAGRCLCYIPIM